MAHFALLNETKTVVDVIVISNDDCGGGDFPASEPIGQQFIASLNLPGVWLQTSYSGGFRNIYAGVGCKYDDVADVFIAPPKSNDDAATQNVATNE